MASFKCKMCGGDLHPIEAESLCECEFCGSTQTVPAMDDEKKTTLFNRANRLRMNAEFDKAAAVYSAIAAEFPEEAEAYWGLCLCKYGIEYVDDPATGKKIPTCHRTLTQSIMDDPDFDQACENADSIARRVYREEAKCIDQLQQDILRIVSSEESYDAFICYKENDENGDRTEDSALAEEIYEALTDKGLKVFFARITLEDKLGQQYEPYIYAALHSSKVMLVIGTQYDYFDAVWVKNEWARFLDMMGTDRKKKLIPCYKGIDAYDMPREFKNLQAQDMGKIGWLQDLVRGVMKLIGPEESKLNSQPIAQETTDPAIGNYLTRAHLFLEQKEQEQAQEYYNKALDKDPHNVNAYIGLLLSEYYFTREEQITAIPFGFPDNKNYKTALRFADEDTKDKLNRYVSIREQNMKAFGPFFWYYDCAKMCSFLKQFGEDKWEDLVKEYVELIAAMFLAFVENDNKPTKTEKIYQKMHYINPDKYVWDEGSDYNVELKDQNVTAAVHFIGILMGYCAETRHEIHIDLGITEPILTGDYDLHPKLEILGQVIDVPYPVFKTLCFSRYTDAYKGMSPEDVIVWGEYLERIAETAGVHELFCLLGTIYYVYGVCAGEDSYKEKAYTFAKKTMDSATSPENLAKCERIFMGISDYKDSQELAQDCHSRQDQMEKARFLNDVDIKIDAARTEKELDEIKKQMDSLFSGTDIDVSNYYERIEQMRLTIREEIRKAEDKRRQEEIRKAEEERERERKAKAEEERKIRELSELKATLPGLEQQLAAKKNEINNLTGFFSKNKRAQAEQDARNLVIRIQEVKDKIKKLT